MSSTPPFVELMLGLSLDSRAPRHDHASCDRDGEIGANGTPSASKAGGAGLAGYALSGFLRARSEGGFLMPNVRAKRATTAGRQARAGENVPRTARPGLVACRWRSA